jgi:hypothetical protein
MKVFYPRIAALLLFSISAAAQTSIFKIVPTPDGNLGVKQNSLNAVSASSSSDIWAVGDTTIHYDGTTWTAFNAPMFDGGGTSYLSGVVDISPTEAWAVGITGVTLGTVSQQIEHWDGTAWSIYPGPTFAPGAQPDPQAMASSSANDIWAIGSLLTANQLLEGLYEHWDGKSWTAQTGPLFGFPSRASADAPNDVWAVGYSVAGNLAFLTYSEHYDGKSWKNVSTPNVGTGSNALSGVLALAPDNVWAVGYSTATLKPPQGHYDVPTKTLIEHYDGAKWSVVPSPNIGPNSQFQNNKLMGLTAVSPTDIYAFGGYLDASGNGNSMNLVLHYDGASWTIIPTPTPKPGSFWYDILNGGVVTGPGDVWLVGSEDPARYGEGVTGTMVLHTTGG